MFLDPSCVLYLPLHKKDGAKFISDDAYGRLCTVTGAVWRLNGGIFNGSSDFIGVTPTTGFPSGASPFTVIQWLNSSKFDGGFYQTSYSIGTAAANQAMFLCFDGLNNDGTLLISRYGGDVLNSVGALTLNKWHQVALTYNGTTLSLYIDGVFDSSATYTFNIVLGTVNVGRLIGGVAGYYHQGIIGETLVYNRLLLASEIQQNRQATKWRY